MEGGREAGREEAASGGRRRSPSAGPLTALPLRLPPALPSPHAHTQVDNWQQVNPEWLVTWVSDHARDAKTILKKPLVLEEVRRGRRCPMSPALV